MKKCKFTILGLLLIMPSYSVWGEDRIYQIGVVPQFEVTKLRAIWQPIINYLKKETGYNFKIAGSPTIPDFEDEFLQGHFDFAYMNPYHIMLANKSVGYVPLVRDVEGTLYGILVVRKDSTITDVSQLNNKTIAFPAPNALGASLQIRQELHDKFNIKIYTRYVKTHDSSYLNVLLGEVAAGGGVQKTLNQQPQKFRSGLRILHKTLEVVPHPIAVHPRVPANVAENVKIALLKLGSTTHGREILSKIPIKKIGSATMQEYLPLKDLKLERFYVR